MNPGVVQSCNGYELSADRGAVLQHMFAEKLPVQRPHGAGSGGWYQFVLVMLRCVYVGGCLTEHTGLGRFQTANP